MHALSASTEPLIDNRTRPLSQSELGDEVVRILHGSPLSCETPEELLKSRRAQKAFNALLSLPESQNGKLAFLNDEENAARHERGKPDPDSHPWERGDFQRETDRKAKEARDRALAVLWSETEAEILKSGADFRQGLGNEFWPEVEAFCSSYSKTGFPLRKALEMPEASMSQSDFENLFSLCPVVSTFEAFLRSHSAFSKIAFRWPISARQIFRAFGADTLTGSKGSLWDFEKAVREKAVAASELRPDLLKVFLDTSSNLALYARVVHGFRTKSAKNGDDESQSVLEEGGCSLLVLEDSIFNQYCLYDGRKVVMFKNEGEMLRHLEAENLMPDFLQKKKFRVLAGEEGKERIIEKDGIAYFIGYGRSSKERKAIPGVWKIVSAHVASSEFFSARTEIEWKTTDVLLVRGSNGNETLNIAKILERSFGKGVDDYFVHVLFGKERDWSASVSKTGESGFPTELVATFYGSQASFAWSVVTIEYDEVGLLRSISKSPVDSDYSWYSRYRDENNL